MQGDFRNSSKLLAIGTPKANGKHAKGSVAHGGERPSTGFATWVLGVFFAALPLFVIPFFRLVTSSYDIWAMFVAAFGSTAMLYVGITMAVTSINDVNRAGVSQLARVFHTVGILLLALGLVAYCVIALAPEVGRDVDFALQLRVNVVYVSVVFVVGCLGYASIRRG